MASASMTMGLLQTSMMSSMTSSVSLSSPSPGPMTIASDQGRSSSISSTSFLTRCLLPESSCTMKLGEYEATGTYALSGTAIRTRSTLMRYAPMPTSAGAPV